MRAIPRIWLTALYLACTATVDAQAPRPRIVRPGEPGVSAPGGSSNALMARPQSIANGCEVIEIGLPQLEALALERNPTLAQAAAHIAAARGKALQAGLWLNPDIGYLGDLIGADGTAGEIQGGFVQQTIVTGGKLRLSRAKYNQEAVEADIIAMGQQLKVLNGVRMRYWDLIALQRMVDVHRQLRDNAKQLLVTRKEQFNTGQATRPEVLLSEVAVNRAEIDLRRLQNNYQAAWQTLVAIVNAPELKPTMLHGELEPAGLPLEFEHSLQVLLEDSPELQAAHAHAVHDQIMVQRERRQPIPDITVNGNLGYNFETPGTVGGVQAGINLPLFDRNQGTIRQAQADLARSIAEIQRIELSLRKRLADTFSAYLTAFETVRIYKDSTLPKMEEAYKIQQEMYKVRRLPFVEVVRMQRELLTLRSEYTQALLELRHAEVAIRGLLMVDGLIEPSVPLPGGHIDSVPKPR